ncbi:MAG TPA: aminotransferase class IV [Stellaceae bacterium]|nr:aminotransferase class IV [Stellaceae bacterium]
MALTNERVAWFNGRIVRESEVVIPFRDQGFLRGDAVFDMTRSFGGEAFRLKEHVARLYRSLKYLDIDPGVSPAEMVGISEDVLARNRHLLGPGEDYWIGQRVSRGVQRAPGDNWEHYGPNVIVECLPLPLKERAALFRDGIAVITPSMRRTPPEALSPRAKMHQYLNLILADREVKAQNPAAWAVLLDTNGNLSEGQGSNIFLVRDGGLLTPRERFVLPGVTRATIIELAGRLGIPCAEADIDLYDAYTAEECFLTSTSLVICGVKSLNGRPFSAGVPGPVTAQLTEAFKELVGCDFVAQYLARL